MTRTLADIVLGALRSRDYAIESVSDAPQPPYRLLALAEHVHRELLARRIATDEPVHVVIGNRPLDLGVLFGVWRAGAVAVPIHVTAPVLAIERVRRASRARFLIDGERLDTIGEAPPPDRPLLSGAALVILTSGSTGEPKGVVIGHQRFVDKLTVLDSLLNIGANDAVLLPLQLTFIFGLWVSLLTLMKRARLILVPKFTSAAMQRGLADATVLGGVPSMFRTLLSYANVPAPNLRAILTGGEVMSPALARAMLQFAPVTIHDLYGLTETGSCDFCLGPTDQPQGFGTIGRTTDGVEFRLVQNGRAVTAGEMGELQVRTPYGMFGYLDNPELTAASFDGDYFRTGDLARLTAAGYVELIGRAKDIVSRGGNKIAPLEIDNLLAEHPDIAAALCGAVPDERLGEVIHAVVVPRAGARVDTGSLRDWLLARTDRFKVPDVFHVRGALPSGSSGKVDRRIIAQLAMDESNRR
jgi:long-chain acyl-CoA synthetase